jgi:hypothetical protein
MKCLGRLTTVGLLLGIGLGVGAASVPGSASAAPPPPPGHGKLKPDEILPLVDYWHLGNFPPVKDWAIQKFMLAPGTYQLGITYRQPDPDHPVPPAPHLNYPSEPGASIATIGVVWGQDVNGNWLNDASQCIPLPPIQTGKTMGVTTMPFTIPAPATQEVRIAVLNPLTECKK